MDQDQPKIAKTWIDPSVRQRATEIGKCCEVLRETRLDYCHLGDYSYVGEYCEIADAEIGKFCAIANMVRIGAPNHPMQRPSQHRFTYVPEYYQADALRDAVFFSARRAARVVIGPDVWIGHGAILLPGVQIGAGAVIAAGAVVTKNVAPYSLVGGVPAKLIRERFSRKIAQKLLDIAWWDWPEERLFSELVAFQSDNIEDFCARFLPDREKTTTSNF